MNQYFNEAKWDHALKYDDWYIRIWDELSVLMKRSRDEDDDAGGIKDTLRQYFMLRIADHKIPFKDHGFNLDADRCTIDTVIIHHTSNPKPYTLEKMNAVQMLNLYVTYFQNPRDEREIQLKGKALWSGHGRDGQPVFWAYHWLVRRDGLVERLLEDNELGWHARMLF